MFCVFDGSNGFGKTTLVRNLKEHPHLKDHLDRIVFTKEPTPAFDYSRLVDGAMTWEDVIEDRRRHCDEVILPALQQKKIVICDRWTLSTATYLAKQRPFWETLLEQTKMFPIPDLWFVHCEGPHLTPAENVKLIIPKMRENDQKLPIDLHIKRIEYYKLFADRMKHQNVRGVFVSPEKAYSLMGAVGSITYASQMARTILGFDEMWQERKTCGSYEVFTNTLEDCIKESAWRSKFYSSILTT